MRKEEVKGGGVNRLVQSQYKLQQLQQYTITIIDDTEIVSEKIRPNGSARGRPSSCRV